MEQEGIEKIYLDPISKNLVVEYKNQAKRSYEENDNLNSQLSEIKSYFQAQTSPENQSFNTNDLRQEVNADGGKNQNNKGNGALMAGLFVLTALVLILLGYIFYKKRTQRY